MLSISLYVQSEASNNYDLDELMDNFDAAVKDVRVELQKLLDVL